MHVAHRTPEPNDADGNEAVYAAYERFLEETDEPEGGLRFALRAL